jgi:CBS domain-containing protein
MSDLKVRDVMTTEVFAVAPDTGLDSVAKLLTAKRISGAPVVGIDGKPLGVISLADLADQDRDVRGRQGYSVFYRISDGLTEFGPDEEDDHPGCAEDVMEGSVISIDADSPIDGAAAMLIEHQIHRLLVVSEDKLVGIVSSLDVLKGVTGR